MLLLAAVQPLVVGDEVGLGLGGQAEEVLGVAPLDQLQVAAGLASLQANSRIVSSIENRDGRPGGSLRRSTMSTSEDRPSGASR